MNNATLFLYGDSDQYDSAFENDGSLCGKAFAPAPEGAVRAYRLEPVEASALAPEVKPLDLSSLAETIIADSFTQTEAGWRLVTLAKRHGIDAVAAFRYARGFLKVAWAKRPQAQCILPKIDRAAARFTVSEIKTQPDWRARLRREEALQQLKFNRRQRQERLAG
jgi:hypothetical protein